MQKKFGSNRKSGSSKPLKIAVFMGGSSPERDVSLRSGAAVKAALDSLGYETCVIDPSEMGPDVYLNGDYAAAFIALHGRGGEDGGLQNLLEKSGIPYIGSGPEGCKLSFDKAKAKAVLKKKGIPTADYCVVDASNWKSALKNFPLPFFVKPLDDGSSIGAFGVDDFKKSAPLIQKGIQTYGRLLVEPKITGREFTVAVLLEKALSVIELKPKRRFYDYKAKYTKGLCEYLVPAPVSEGEARKMRRIALEVHKALEMRDVSRVDIMMDEGGNLFVLEANAIPGMTEMSLLPKAARESGISFEKMCELLIQKAYARRKRPEGRRRLVRTPSSRVSMNA